MLLSYAFYGSADLADLWQFTERHGHQLHAFADSGAFTVEAQGAAIDLGAYSDWIERHADRFAAYAVLDVIGDADATAANLASMEARGLAPIPVFHRGTPWKVLEDYCADYPYVAVGGMASEGSLNHPSAIMRWLIRCFQIAADTGTVIHGFGLTRMMMLSNLPFYSADSSSWQAGVRFGSVMVFDRRAGSFKRATMSTPSIWRIAADLRRYGVDPEVLAAPRGEGSIYHFAPGAVAGAAAFIEYQNYQRRRHGPVKLAGQPPGLHLYLAAAAESVLRAALEGLPPEGLT